MSEVSERLQLATKLSKADLSDFIIALIDEIPDDALKSEFGGSIADIRKMTEVIMAEANDLPGGLGDVWDLINPAETPPAPAADEAPYTKQKEEVFCVLFDDHSVGADDLLSLVKMRSNGTSVAFMAKELQRSEAEVKMLLKDFAAAEKTVGKERLHAYIGHVKIETDAMFGDEMNETLTTVPQDVPVTAQAPVVAQTPAPAKPVPPPPAEYVKGSIKRTSLGLRDSLFDAMDRLIAGEISPNEAKAVAGLADAICKTVKLEMDAEKMRQADQLPAGGPPILRLGSDAG